MTAGDPASDPAAPASSLAPGAAPALAPVATLVVRSPSLVREAGAVLRAIVAIGFITAIAMTAELGGGRRSASRSGSAGPRSAGAGSAGELALRPNQVSFAELPAADQRMIRRCLDGLAEAEQARSRSGTWPTVEELAARGVPPFAADPLDGAGYRWQRLLDGTLVNYLGVPAPQASPARPSLLLVALEPDPGTPIDPAAIVDESHHKLADGSMIHVSISVGSAPAGPPTITRPTAMPAFEDGWRLVVISTPHVR